MSMWAVFLWCFAVACATPLNPPGASIAEKCGTLLQAPTSSDTFDFLRRTMELNCFEYYNVGVNHTVLTTVETAYDNGVSAAQDFEAAYSTNEHVLYSVKAWLNMDAAEPLTKVQRGLKECNAQMLVNFFGAEDIRLLLPTFVSSLNYMQTCFQRVSDDAARERTQLLGTYTTKERDINASAQAVVAARQHVEDAHEQFAAARVVFETAIETAFSSVVK